MKTMTKNKIIILFEEDHDINDILSIYNISKEELKNIIKDYVYTFSLSKLDINSCSIDFINEIKEQFKSNVSIEKLASKYNMTHYDIAYIIHMIYNKKYIYFLTVRSKKIEPYYMIRLLDLGFTHSEVATACGCSRDNVFHRIKQHKDKMAKKEKVEKSVSSINIDEVVSMFENYYSIKHIANKYGVSEDKITLALKRYYPNRKNLYNSMPAEFIEKLLEEGLSAEDIAEKYTRNLSYIEKIVSNIEIRKAKEKEKAEEKRYIDDQKEYELKKKEELENKIIKLYLTGKYTLIQISEELSLDYFYVVSVKKKYIGNKRVPDIGALIELIKQGYSDEEIRKMSNGTNIILNDEMLENARDEFNNAQQIK